MIDIELSGSCRNLGKYIFINGGNLSRWEYVVRMMTQTECPGTWAIPAEKTRISTPGYIALTAIGLPYIPRRECLALMCSLALEIHPLERPMHNLPVELLIQIFTYVCERPSVSRYNTPSFSTPLFLGKICRHWREITWSIPSLWQYIDLVLPTTKQSVYAELLAAWLERSQSLPLTIIYRRDESKASLVRNWG